MPSILALNLYTHKGHKGQTEINPYNRLINGKKGNSFCKKHLISIFIP